MSRIPDCRTDEYYNEKYLCKDALAQLMAAANYANDENEYQPIEIVRSGKTILKFTIRPLSEEEFNQCRKASTKSRNRKRSRSKLEF